jgi:glycosyltransferase involved in cell wall biosynthesis
LEQAGFSYQIAPFYSDKTWEILYRKGDKIAKFLGVLGGFLKRITLIFNVSKYDFVFIHREICPIGPPIFEWIIAKLLHKKLIFDFDDAIWLTDEKARLTNLVRCFWKVGNICSYSYKISTGNEYLADYARQFNNNVIINPTTIDLEHHKTSENTKNEFVTIGWTGSHSTLKYLQTIYPVLKKLEDKCKLLVICDVNPEYDLKHYEFVPWSEENEVLGLQKIDIGIMPLPNNEWTKGKCGFKALQYMALKKAVILSPVGVNTQIIQDNKNGYWADTEQEWESKILELIQNKELRNEFGLLGFETLKNHYSVEANKENFLNLFD